MITASRIILAISSGDSIQSSLSQSVKMVIMVLIVYFQRILDWDMIVFFHKFCDNFDIRVKDGLGNELTN